MILVRSAGRLGNQLFVVAALRKLTAHQEPLVLVGFEDLVESFPGLRGNAHHIPMPRKHWWRWTLAEKILGFLGFLHIVSVISSDPRARRLVRSRGVFPLSVFRGGWCQDEKLIDPDISQALFSADALDALSPGTAEMGLLPATQENPVFFVHIRRGDYLTWPTEEFPAALPETWYLEGVARIRDSHPQAQFLIFSDDEAFASEFAKNLESARAMQMSPAETLACMSLCTGGILSASSFSWWGGQLASRRSPGPFFAPLHWITWGEERWDDSHSLEDTSFVTWIPVIPSTGQRKKPSRA